MVWASYGTPHGRVAKAGAGQVGDDHGDTGRACRGGYLVRAHRLPFLRVWRLCFGMAARGEILVRMVFLMAVCACLVGACGHASVPSSTSSTPSAAASHVSASAPTVTVQGCGTYCQQAGISQGGPGAPCPKAACLKCPPQGCVTLESGGATATNGVVGVKLRCNLSAACRGIFLICLPGYFCSLGQTAKDSTGEAGFGGRLAGSDLVVPPGTTSEVGVALTALGRQVVSGHRGFQAMVEVGLLDYGMVIDSSSAGNFSLTSTDPPTYPAGATGSCGGIVFVGPNTSCPFAEKVKRAYSNAYSATSTRPDTVSVASPVTGVTYEMRCTGESPVACRGGTNALVEFYR
jgi:hypothetical protein